MKNIIFLSVLSLFIFISCGDDDSESQISSEGGPFAISELAGNWEATEASFFSVVNNNSVDIVADGGSLSLSVQSNRRCTFTIDPFDREAYTVSGEMFWGNFEGDEALVIVWDDSSRSPFRWIEFNDTTFDLGCTSECGEYDFDNNGNIETADLSFYFIRN
jgi:hypothetical protein